MRMTPISAVASSVVVLCLPGRMLSTGNGLASATASACSWFRPARAKACFAPRAVATARTYRAAADVSVSEMGFCTRILWPSSTTMSRLPALNEARAALRSGSWTSWTGIPTAVDTCCSSVSRVAEPETTPTHGRAVLLVCKVGMTTAAATTAKRMTVTTRNTRPRTRSRISRPATSPVCPRNGFTDSPPL